MDKKKAAFSGSLSVGETQGNSTTPAACTAPQHLEILKLLRAGEAVTVYQLHGMGINAATARIKELRDAGYPIIDRWEPILNKHGKQVRRKVYTLAAHNTSTA